MQFHSLFNMLISGGSSSGKTTLLIKFLKQIDQLVDNPPEVIRWCYGTFSNQLISLQENPLVTLINGVPSVEELQSENRRSMRILDDLMTVLDKKTFADMFSKIGHHSNCSIILLCQNSFYGSLRDVRINCHYIFLMRNISDGFQVRTLSHQIFEKDAKVMQEAYEDACKKPYSYLLINIHPSCENNLRLFTNIFSDDGPLVVYTPKVSRGWLRSGLKIKKFF